MIEAQPILPGVEAISQGCQALGIENWVWHPAQPSQWVIGHLTRHGSGGIISIASALLMMSSGIKPDPELYLSVLHGLEVSADEAIALEDSPIGIRSAKGAGLYCVAVPNALTSQLDLSQADFHLGSLAEMPLEQLLEKVNAIKTQRAAL